MEIHDNRTFTPTLVLLVTFAATLLPVSLFWDYSWESTVGVDRVWSPPHLATHASVWLFAIACSLNMLQLTRSADRQGTSIGRFRALPGAWIIFWGVAAFATAFWFDNWWQRSYGLAAGIWHPPQMLKAASFIALQFGAILFCYSAQRDRVAPRRLGMALHLGLMIALIHLMLGTLVLPNLQHAGTFYRLGCAVFPAVLMLGAVAAGVATGGAVWYGLIVAATVWILPWFPARPLTGPVHNPMDHLMPPSFPMLLLVPAIVFDLAATRSNMQSGSRRRVVWAVLVGSAFVALFVPTQWWFAKFLLSPAADNWFFAGGGRHWPFFLKIDAARTQFWQVTQDPIDAATILTCLALAGLSALAGLHAGSWIRSLRR